ncbi:hypothetical protein E2C01_072660 [Portunus trituberculatus]|uniref:Uncharacterized protein n=1 Tax=Portunus trituberculatus TaxID=210409 RepID=A0A5B7IBB5_PORTR|nr:hypothetical protein [Portunus trituberculatus]
MHLPLLKPAHFSSSFSSSLRTPPLLPVSDEGPSKPPGLDVPPQHRQEQQIRDVPGPVCM